MIREYLIRLAVLVTVIAAVMALEVLLYHFHFYEYIPGGM